MNNEELNRYHKHITDTYDERSVNHDNSEWHRATALKLVEDMPPRAGSTVLDIGTGTGFIAFHVADLVGEKGNVIGVDLSEGMLSQARSKLQSNHAKNIQFLSGDMEQLDLPENSIDHMYCASAFFCVLNPLDTLRHWRRLLRPNGSLAFHALPATSYFWVSIARDVLSDHGIDYLLNTPTATIEKTRTLLKNAGFKKVDIREEEQGYYIPWEQAKDSWITINDFAPGQYPHPVASVSKETLDICKEEYLRRLQALNTDQGVWNDVTLYYVYAYK
jgi:ubiquinone/menaquinone biosynthesis C-methylase UbiE